MKDNDLHDLLEKLVRQSKESEWVEFKLNYHHAEEIGERISALSNGACLVNQHFGYLIFGVKNDNHTIEGTTFSPNSFKYKGEDVEHWLAQRLSPRIDFRIYEFDYETKRIALFEIPAAKNQPVSFLHHPYIRIASITRKLRDFPEKERKIWKKEPEKPFEKEIALENQSASDIVGLLDTQSYFELVQLPYPTTQKAVIEKFLSEKLLVDNGALYNITNLGAMAFAKNFADFPSLARRVPRVILYKNKDKLGTIKDILANKGYAVGFQGLVDYVSDQLPQNEEISRALRENVKMYPNIAIRELIANSIIHQDFREKGNPVVEIFADRIEFSNPGLPLITPIRFIDDYQSRNEMLADLMRRLRVCEEKGSGIDKVIAGCEVFQLPAPDFQTQEKHTKAIMYAHQNLITMDKRDKVRACYQHCCLKYVSNEKMTNQTLRERFKIKEHNYSIASRIIRDCIEAGFVKEQDPNNKSKKYAAYIPFWA